MRIHWQLMALACVVAVSSGCSLRLDWSDDKRPCVDGECFSGYSCVVKYCYREGSLQEGEGCTDSVQCETNYCAPGLFSCRAECKSFWEARSECATEFSSEQYCEPVLNQDAEWEGACIESTNCVSDEECPDGDFCVPISADVTACIPGCEITWEGANYSDTCGDTPQDRMYCQPVGLEGQERLVCQRSSSSAAGEGEICDPVENPCLKGLACINGRCLKHCDPTPGAVASCGSGTVCCEQQGGDNYGVCAEDCDI